MVYSKNNVTLKNNQKFILDLNSKEGDQNRVFLPHKEIFKSVKKNNKILIDDGKIVLNIEKVLSDQIITEVLVGGKISNRKGVNIPENFIKMSSLTEKDIRDLKFCLDLSLDYIALSFVQKAKDINDLKKYVGNKQG